MPDYPKRLAHATPAWVSSEAVYHIRIRIMDGASTPLTDESLAQALLDSVRFYHDQTRWHCSLFLLMPDHLHALIAFPQAQIMSVVMGAWKGYQTKRLGVRWQENFFDHRLRNRKELDEKAAYIRLNPVVKNLCAKADDWPWFYRP